MNRPFFSTYLQKSTLIATPEAYQEILKDPSGDDYHYFRGSDYDAQQLGILDRYKKYNGEEGKLSYIADVKGILSYLRIHIA